MKFGKIEDLEGIDFEFPPLPSLTKEVLKTLPKPKKVEFYFGAPVWSDKNYKGSLYPPKTPQKDFLKAYSQQFNSIEFNGTRYGVPKQNSLDKWKAETPDNFKFSMKFPQVITHRKNITDKDAKERLEQFLFALDYMENKTGVSFAVMANYFRPDKFSTLVDFVESLPKDMDFAIELRAPEWFETTSIIDEWHQLFIENNIVPVLTDTPGRRDVLHFRITNEHLFVRFVGGIESPIDDFRIEQWAKRIIELTHLHISKVWFYAHVSSENRQEIVPFFNQLIGKLNSLSDFNIAMLKDYSTFDN